MNFLLNKKKNFLRFESKYIIRVGLNNGEQEFRYNRLVSAWPSPEVRQYYFLSLLESLHKISNSSPKIWHICSTFFNLLKLLEMVLFIKR